MTPPTPSRRTVLCSTAAALSGVAGCVATRGESGDTPTAEPTGTDAPDPGDDRSTAASRQGTTATAGESENDSLAYASTGTTTTGIDLAGNPILGAPDAPVDMYYWSDFQCPFCHRFEQNTAPKLLENEVAGGTLRVVFLELPNVGSDSTTAALVAKCVWRQVKDTRPDAYYRWHAAVYDNQGEPDSGWATRERLLALTESVDGVDADAVDACLTDHRAAVEASVEADVDQAGKHGVSVTPGFVLADRESGETRTLTGAQPYARFQSEIRAIDRQ